MARPLLCNRIASQDFLDLSLCTESPLCKKVIICTLIDETEISMSPASNIPFSVNQPTFIAVFIFIGILAGLKIVVDKWVSDKQREKRRNYYRDTYLSSDDWKRKRALVLKRDSYRCVYCGARATQVHHKRYARRNIGREPIEWLVAMCKPCYERQHEH